MSHPIWVIITAGGQGVRFGQNGPKQYIEIAGKPVISHSLAVFDCLPNVQAFVIPLPKMDGEFDQTILMSPFPVMKVSGGQTRMLSVANALNKIRQHAAPDDWVMVHDAVRPCLHPHDLQKLYVTLTADPVGGILAKPVTDTIKKVQSDNRIIQTVPRQDLWQALTPQMFRFSLLDEAILHAIEHELTLTDDASAMEALGYTPTIVCAEYPNPKLTTTRDLPFIEHLLERKSLCSV